MSKLTKQEIEVLKEYAQDLLFSKALREGREYRNRFETYEDAYNNLKAMGFTHKGIIDRIGKKDDAKGEQDE